MELPGDPRNLKIREVIESRILTGSNAANVQRLRFRAEAEALASLNHPHIVQIHEIGEQTGQPFLVMEYLDGGTLADRAASGPLDPHQSAELLRDLASAMHYAHERGIVHRDLKPSNILLTRDGTAKISDFGVAKQLHRDDQQTRDGSVIGSPGYMSPEQARGESNHAGPPADVYALGAILYRLITGQECFRSGNTLGELRRVLEEEPKAPRRIEPGVPRDLETICLKCLRKEPHERYASARDLAADLARFLQGEPIAARPVGRVERLVKWTRRHPAQASVYALLVLVCLLGAGIAGSLLMWKEAKAARDETEQARLETSAARDSLLHEQELTQAALLREEQLHKKLALSSYLRNVELAHREWQGNAVHRAPGYLADVPPAMRGWEWHLVDGLCHSQDALLAHYPNGVMSIAVDPQERYLVSAVRGGDVEVWDLPSRKVRHALRLPEEWITSIRIHPSGRLIACASWAYKVHLLDPRATILHTIPCKDRMATVAFSPDGALLAGSGMSRDIQVWDTATRQLRWNLRGHQGWTGQLLFTGDGRHLISTSEDRTIRVWDMLSGREVRSWIPHRKSTTALCFLPDGKRLITGGSDGEARVWDFATGQQLGDELLRSRGVFCLKLSKDERYLVASGRDGEIHVFDATRLRPLAVYRGHVGSVYSLVFLQRGNLLLSAGEDGTIRLCVQTALPGFARSKDMPCPSPPWHSAGEGCSPALLGTVLSSSGMSNLGQKSGRFRGTEAL